MENETDVKNIGNFGAVHAVIKRAIAQAKRRALAGSAVPVKAIIQATNLDYPDITLAFFRASRQIIQLTSGSSDQGEPFTGEGVWRDHASEGKILQ